MIKIISIAQEDPIRKCKIKKAIYTGHNTTRTSTGRNISDERTVRPSRRNLQFLFEGCKRNIQYHKYAEYLRINL